MNSPVANPESPIQPLPAKPKQSHAPAWYRPIVSPEHGVYVMLLVSFLTGAAAAQTWTWETTLALLCAFGGFQAEHPLILQIRQRRSFRPRFWLWGSLYGLTALSIAIYLYLHHTVLLWIFAVAVVTLAVDAISVLQREQKSRLNEFITFCAVCLSAPLAYAATTGALTILAIGLWLLNSLFFSSAIFTVKLRKQKTSSLIPVVIYHLVATLAVVGLYSFGFLPLITAVAFTIALLKFGLIVGCRTWYTTAPIQQVALLETGSALLFLAIVALSVLPVRL